MAGLTTGGPNVDVSLLYGINGLTRHTPGWLDRAVSVIGEYGILLALVLLVLWCWRGARRQDEAAAVESFAALVWAPLAAGAALLLNIPLREFVARPRPAQQHGGVEVLDPGAGIGHSPFSFVSDHTTLAMALGVGLFIAHRKLGFVGIGLALLEGFTRVYTGIHYPTDVIGGLALGTAVVLLLAPLAMALLTPVVRAVARSPRLGVLVRAGGRALPRPVDLAQAPPAVRGHESDLAA
ncbi:phosphatase PAP2 family protein [Streptomyces sp. ISL-43]|uniref:phosphatase PAP2 family protein n=1 Tax=Streptomyces sp. ISL-43 TaxID=2819183 RepID=UPI001BEC1DB2|nr:phosphatase PAP2 family protein [Streptomyces sp. ISL-43]MBT2452712.1 phosphatase PAP2 family protein [Streptomyces sp. ISL-43]